MGEALYDQIVGPERLGRPCRVYAPVGSHEELLAYLVRRLLENGANTSFVNRIVDERQPIDQIIADPAARLARLPAKPQPRIPLPADLYMPARPNSRGLDLDDPPALAELREALSHALDRPWHAAPIIGGVEQHRRGRAGARPERSPPPGRDRGHGRAGTRSSRRSPAPCRPHPHGSALEPASARRSSNAPPTCSRAIGPH